MGSTGTMNFHWDGIRGRIRSLSMEEKFDFERVVNETKARKDAERNGTNDLFESQQDYKTSRPKTPYEAKMKGKKGRGINDEGGEPGDLF